MAKFDANFDMRARRRLLFWGENKNERKCVWFIIKLHVRNLLDIDTVRSYASFYSQQKGRINVKVLCLGEKCMHYLKPNKIQKLN